MERFVEVQGVRVPRFLYGTAWKEQRTEGLTRLALEVGFRGIDTANQRKHYFEAGVGAAIRAAGIARDELFLQTKFTDARGQDYRLPYDPDAPLGRQVEQSFASSLEHLGVDHLIRFHGVLAPEARPREGPAWRVEDAAPGYVPRSCRCDTVLANNVFPIGSRFNPGWEEIGAS